MDNVRARLHHGHREHVHIAPVKTVPLYVGRPRSAPRHVAAACCIVDSRREASLFDRVLRSPRCARLRTDRFAEKTSSYSPVKWCRSARGLSRAIMNKARLSMRTHLLALERKLRDANTVIQHDAKSWCGDSNPGGWIYVSSFLVREPFEQRSKLESLIKYEEYDSALWNKRHV